MLAINLCIMKGNQHMLVVRMKGVAIQGGRTNLVVGMTHVGMTHAGMNGVAIQEGMRIHEGS